MTSRSPTIEELEALLKHAQGVARRDALTRLAWVVRRTDVVRAEALAREALDTANADDPPATRVRATLTLAFVTDWRGDVQGAMRLAESALGSDGDPGLAHRAHVLLARSAVILGQLERARLHADAASEIATRVGDDELRAAAASAQAVVALSARALDDAEARFLAVLELANGRYPLLHAEALCCLGIVAIQRGHSRRAIELLSRSLSAGVAVGNLDAIARARVNLGIEYARLGHPVQARAHLLAALTILRDRGHRRGIAKALVNVGRVERALGSADAAVSNCEDALGIFREIGDTSSEMSAMRTLGALRMDRGELDAAEQCFEEIHVLATAAGRPRFAAHAVIGLARVLTARGALEEAVRQYERGVELMADRAAKSAQAQALIWLSSAQIDGRQVPAALVSLRRAILIASALDSPRHLIDVRRELARAHESQGDFASAYRESKEAERLSVALTKSRELERQDQLRTILELEHARTKATAEQERSVALARANSSLSRANDDLRELVQVVAHDLRSPLTAVLGGADLMSSATPDALPAIADAMLGTVVTGAEQMEQIISSLLDAGVVEAGKRSDMRASLDLCGVVEAAIAQHRSRARSKNIDLSVESPGAPVATYANSIALRRALDNLLSNALKFSPAGGCVLVRVAAATTADGGPVARCEVHDSGPGFSDGDRARLFERFTRLSARPTAGEPSTGLGLYIVGELVRSMSGTVECGESHLGGARFVVDLPPAPA